MASITQDLKFKQAVIQYSLKHGVTAAAKRYKRTRQWIANTAVYAETQRKSRTKPPQGQRNVLCKENVLQPGRLQQAIKEIHERVQQLPDEPPGLEVAQRIPRTILF